VGEIREGLGEMASPVELGQALAAIGLFARVPGEADLAGERKRLGSTELLRLETTHWLAGTAAVQVIALCANFLYVFKAARRRAARAAHPALPLALPLRAGRQPVRQARIPWSPSGPQ
jgi:hypothetical protein